MFGSKLQVIRVRISIGDSPNKLTKMNIFVRNIIKTIKKQQIVLGERYPFNVPDEGRHGKGPFLKNLSVPKVELKSDEKKALRKRIQPVECLSQLKILTSRAILWYD